jgi:hypothetical protein
MAHFSNPVNPEQNRVFHLTEVIRNSKNIFQASKLFCITDRECKVRHEFDGPEVIWNAQFTDGDLEYYSNKFLDVIDSYVSDTWCDLKEVAPQDICILVENKDKAKKLQSRIKEKDSIIAPFIVEEMVDALKHGNWYTQHRERMRDGQCGVVVDSISRYTGLGSKVVILVVNYRGIMAKIIEKVYTGMTRASCKLIVLLSKNGLRHLEHSIGNVITSTASASSEPMDIDL